MEQPNVIVAYLTALRKTVRRRLLGYGLFAALAGGVTSFLTVVTLDWLFWLPPALRMFGGILFVAGFIGALIHWVVRPLRARLGIDELAAELERRFEALQDRLSSTVNFLEQAAEPSPLSDGSRNQTVPGSATMMRQVIADTERVIQGLPLGAALSIRPLAIRGVIFAAGLAALAAVMLVAPQWARTGLNRYVDPWGAVEWPRNVAIVPLTGEQTVALGESATVRMEIQRGLHDALRGVVHLREPDGRTQMLALQRDQDGTFYTTVDAIAEDLEYWFEAGDDSTERRPSKIHVVRRPEVIEALATLSPPPYAKTSAIRVADLTDGSVSAPVGGYVTIMLRTSKPIQSQSAVGRPDPTGEVVGLRTENGELIPLAVDQEDARQLSCRFEVTQDLIFRAELRDEEGFANRGATAYTIRATPDSAPTVTVLEPTAMTELTPTGSVRLAARVEDEFGVVGLELHIEGPGEGKASDVPLSGYLRTVREDDGVEVLASYLWSVESLALTAGDLLTYQLVAEDNHAGPDGHGQLGRSSPLRIKIVGEGEFEVRLREDLASVEARLRQVAIEEAALRDRTMGLVRAEGEATALDANERDAVASLSGGQARLAHQLRELSGRLDELKGRMERNHAGDAESASRLAASGDTLRRIAAGPMGEAVVRLGRIHEQLDVSSQQADLTSAARAEEEAYDQLNALLRSMSQWGTFQSLVSRTRDLLDRQNALRNETADVGKSLLGRPVEALTPAEAVMLKRNERQQERLAGDVEQHLARMEQLASGTREKDPSGADAIESALRAARAKDMTKRLRAAVEAIQSNRTAAAAIDQKAAAEAMRKMLAALRERDDRELAQLRKQLDRAEEQVAALIEEQQALKAATAEAGQVGGDQTTFGSLGGEQRMLARNTKSLGDELVEVPKAASAGRLVRKSADPMGKAEGELREQRAATATQAQDEALQLLKQALDDLEALAQKSAEDAMRRTLAHIQDDLEAMLAAQRMVNGGIAKLRTAVAELGRVGRAESREASKLSREQIEVRELVTAVLPELEKVVVYDWALKRVTRWMEESSNRLDAREIDETLTTTTERIVRELEKLIAAVVETQSLPMTTEFAEAERDGGGGEGAAASAATVPTVAELLVLKAMQVDISERTRILGLQFDGEAATEAQLRQLTMIGEDQAEVRRLTELVTGRAQQPAGR